MFTVAGDCKVFFKNLNKIRNPEPCHNFADFLQLFEKVLWQTMLRTNAATSKVNLVLCCVTRLVDIFSLVSSFHYALLYINTKYKIYFAVFDA